MGRSPVTRARAERHLEELQAEIAHYSEIRPYEVVRERQFDSKSYVYRAHLREQPPPHLALIAGDFIHNLRSSLDHLAVALSKSRHKSKAHFPFVESDFWQTDLDTGAYIKKFATEREVWNRQTGGIAEEPLAIIKGLQPYHCGQEVAKVHPLRILHTLDNTDKHRKLVLVSLGLLNASITIVDPSPDGPLFSQWTPGMLEDGAIVASFPFDDASTEMDVHIHGAVKVAIKMTWANGRTLPVPDGFSDLLAFVRERVFVPLRPFVI